MADAPKENPPAAPPSAPVVPTEQLPTQQTAEAAKAAERVKKVEEVQSELDELQDKLYRQAQEKQQSEREQELREAKTQIDAVQQTITQQMGALSEKQEKNPEDEQSLAKWLEANKKAAHLELRVDSDIALADNPVNQTLERWGVSRRMDQVMDKVSDWGTKLADGAEVAYERFLKPIGAAIMPMLEKIKNTVSGMSQGMKKGIASMLRFMGWEDGAKWIEGVPQNMTAEDQKDLLDIRGLLLPATLQLANSEADLLALRNLRGKREILIGKYHALQKQFAAIAGYIDAAMKEKGLAYTTDKQYAFKDIIEAAEQFNTNAEKRTVDSEGAQQAQRQLQLQPATIVPPPL